MHDECLNGHNRYRCLKTCMQQWKAHGHCWITTYHVPLSMLVSLQWFPMSWVWHITMNGMENTLICSFALHACVLICTKNAYNRMLLLISAGTLPPFYVWFRVHVPCIPSTCFLWKVQCPPSKGCTLRFSFSLIPARSRRSFLRWLSHSSFSMKSLNNICRHTMGTHTHILKTQTHWLSNPGPIQKSPPLEPWPPHIDGHLTHLGSHQPWPKNTPPSFSQSEYSENDIDLSLACMHISSWWNAYYSLSFWALAEHDFAGTTLSQISKNRSIQYMYCNIVSTTFLNLHSLDVFLFDMPGGFVNTHKAVSKDNPVGVRWRTFQHIFFI